MNKPSSAMCIALFLAVQSLAFASAETPGAEPAPVAAPLPPASSEGRNPATATVARCLRQAPPYPPAALRAEQEGRAVVRFAVDASGTVHAERIVRSSGHALLDQAALHHLAQCKERGQMPDAEALAPGQYEFPMLWRLE